MSRIGRMPIAVPAGVTVEIAENNHVTVKGPKGTLERTLPSEMDIKLEGSEVIVTRPNDLKKMKSLHGLTRTLINNMVVGVTEGYTKTLEVNGVGYRASKSGKVLTLNLGYSHPVEMTDPEGIESEVQDNKIIVKGIDKEKVGQYAAEIRDKRRPELASCVPALTSCAASAVCSWVFAPVSCAAFSCGCGFIGSPVIGSNLISITNSPLCNLILFSYFFGHHLF